MLRRHCHQELEDKVWRLTADLTCLTEEVAELKKDRHQKDIDELYQLLKVLKAKAVKIAAKVK